MRISLFAMVCAVSVCLTTTLAGSPAFAVEESQLPDLLDSKILPYYFAHAKGGKFVGVDGVPIAWTMFPPADGSPVQGAKAIVISNGRTEYMRKYAEFIYDVQAKWPSYSIYMLDHRGQGESGRMLPDPLKSYVKNFKDYVTDFGTFIDQVVRKDSPSEIHAIAHSMGCAIATIYAIKHPDAFKSMVMISPMYQPNLGNYPELVALMIGQFEELIGHEDDQAPGQPLDQWADPFQGNLVTHSANRYAYNYDLQLADPELRLGGATFQWVLTTLYADAWIRDHARKLKTPTYVIQAQEEEIVMNADENTVCSRAAHCELEAIEGAKHEILIEVDAVRDRAMAHTMDFIGRPRSP